MLLDCNCILFTQLPWPGDNEGTFRSSRQAATCLPHTAEAIYCPFNCWTSSREAVITDFYSLWFDRPGIEPESTASVADVLSTRPLNDYVFKMQNDRKLILTHCTCLNCPLPKVFLVRVETSFFKTRRSALLA